MLTVTSQFSTTTTASDVELYVDCAPHGIALESFHTFVDEWCRLLCQRYGADDIRCAPADGPLGYGRWEGALAAVAREAIAKGFVPPGSYSLDARGSKVAAVVADALRTSGVFFVRGSGQ
jgi:hypothetical protein